MKPGRNHFFDILRVVSVLFVITSHYSYMFDSSTVLTFPREYLTAGIGRLGVSFFFMISGALAYLSLRKYAAPEYYLRRVYSVLIPYNIAYFGMALLLLALGVFFTYPGNPLVEVGPNGTRSVLDMLPSVLGFDHYLHGVYEIKTVYFTGEWFIGCIILLYVISPLIYRAIVRYPMWTMLATVAITLMAYDTRVTNPYWSAQVRISDFTFGMLFIHLQAQFTRYVRPLALIGALLIVAGVSWAHISHQPVREVLFPLAPVSLLFA
ncbi:MAG: acyltransferase, partial [Edwardsiella sp. (in: enterobacteria)]